jgi:hypothetical protein
MSRKQISFSQKLSIYQDLPDFHDVFEIELIPRCTSRKPKVRQLTIENIPKIYFLKYRMHAFKESTNQNTHPLRHFFVEQLQFGNLYPSRMLRDRIFPLRI